MNKLIRLINDATDQLESRGTIVADREAIMSAMIVNKLSTANKIVSENDDLFIYLNYQEADLNALSKVREYSNLLDSMISYNNNMYNNVLSEALSGIL